MTMVSQFSRADALKFVESIPNGKIFSVTFVKKDGTIREMNCRKGVKKYLSGGELHYKPSEYGLLPVFDMKSQGYRMINFQTIKEIRFHGEKITISAWFYKNFCYNSSIGLNFSF